MPGRSRSLPAPVSTSTVRPPLRRTQDCSAITVLPLPGSQCSGASRFSWAFHAASLTSGRKSAAGRNGSCHSRTRITSTSPSTMRCAVSFTFVMPATLRTGGEWFDA